MKVRNRGSHGDTGQEAFAGTAYEMQIYGVNPKADLLPLII